MVVYCLSDRARGRCAGGSRWNSCSGAAGARGGAARCRPSLCARYLGRGRRDLVQAARGRRLGRFRVLGGRPCGRHRRRDLPGDARGAFDALPTGFHTLRAYHPDLGWPPRRDGGGPHGGSQADADLGLGRRDGPLKGVRRRHGLRGLLLRSQGFVSARHRREHQRSAQVALPQGDGLLGGDGRGGARGTGPAQRQASQDPRLVDADRGDGAHVIGIAAQ